MGEYSVIGKRVPNVFGRSKVDGSAKYTDDLKFPGMLFGGLLRSPYAHAKILSINTTRAEKLKGVKAVITGEDTNKVPYGIFGFTRDQLFLPTDRVRFLGEEVAAVAAVDDQVTAEALELIEVEYEPLPVVTDPEEAMKVGAPQIHEPFRGFLGPEQGDLSRNIGVRCKRDYGDVEGGFKDADLVCEDRFRTVAINHGTLEPYVTLARYDQGSGKVEIWCPNQAPFQKMRAISNLMQMPLNDVVVRKIFHGGAFGGRSETFAADLCAVLLSKRTRKAVKICFTREDTFILRQKHPYIIDIRAGVKKDGTLTALDIRLISDGGAYMSTGPIAIDFPSVVVESMYRTSNFRYESFEVYTNKPVRGAMRGHGGQQMAFAMDSLMDMMAEKIGMDPVDIRLRNARQPGEMLPSKSQIRSCGFTECIQKAAKAMDWGAKKGEHGSRGIGIGCSTMISGFSLGFRTPSSALVKLNDDGEATVITGLQDSGQGNETMAVQIVSEELGIPMEDIRILNADTELTPPDPGNYAMCTTFVSGNAVRCAAADAKEQLKEVVAQKLEANIHDLVIKDRKIFVKGSPSMGMTVKQAVRESFRSQQPVIGRGSYQPDLDLKTSWSVGKIEGQRTGAYTFGAVVVEVEVDRETGQVRLIEAAGAQDVGYALNPSAVEGQNEGSIVLGQGMVLTEDLAWDEGLMLNPNFLDYRMPIAPDMPRIQSIIVESLDQDGPYGAKEATETINIAVIPAIANAIYDAVGVRIKDLPITPQKILAALKGQERKGVDK